MNPWRSSRLIREPFARAVVDVDLGSTSLAPMILTLAPVIVCTFDLTRKCGFAERLALLEVVVRHFLNLLQEVSNKVMRFRDDGATFESNVSLDCGVSMP